MSPARPVALGALLLASIIGGAPAIGLTGSGTLGTSQISAQTCAAQTITVAGAVAGAPCVVGGPSTLEAGLVQTCVVTAPSTATLRTPFQRLREVALVDALFAPTPSTPKS